MTIHQLCLITWGPGKGSDIAQYFTLGKAQGDGHRNGKGEVH